VLPRPPAVVGRLAPRWHDVALIGGSSSASYSSQVGEIDYEGGRFRIDGLVAGEATTIFLRPEGAGTALVLHDLVLEPGEERDLGLLDIPEPVEVRGRVLDADGRPVTGALVRTVEPWYEGRTRTDPEGRFRLPRFPPEPTTLWIESVPSAVAFVPVTAAHDAKPLEIRLPATGRLRVRILGPIGEPVPNTPVNIARLGEDGEPAWDRRTIPRTDSLGGLDLALYPGRYAVIPHANAGLEAVGGNPRVTIAPRKEVEIMIRTRKVH